MVGSGQDVAMTGLIGPLGSQEVTAVNIPASTWEAFVQATEKQKRSAQEMLVWLMQTYTHVGEQVTVGFYGRLTRRYLQGTLPRSGSINTFRLGDHVADAVQAAHKTADVVELIERMRDRR